MSLKAKLEAVIYAAEEPVTLAQLAGLFAEEALEWKATQDAAMAAAIAISLSPGATDPTGMPMMSEAFAYLELEQGLSEANNTAPAEEEAPAAKSDSLDVIPAAQEHANTAPEAAKESEAASAAGPKQEAKQREREARAAIKEVLGELIAEYEVDSRGIEIREIAGGYRMATKPEFHDAVRSFVKSLKPPLKLSLPALETLAVIAYKQPVTAPEVNEIRGVDSSGVFGSLLARKLIVAAGRKQVVGRPILYKTTREFLLRFGLKDVSELPSMEEFEKMAASELAEDVTQEKAGPEKALQKASENGEFSADPTLERDEAEAVAPESPMPAEESSDTVPGNAE
jgi:segregation and condensation protein B